VLVLVLEFAVTDASEIEDEFEDEDDCQVSRLKA